MIKERPLTEDERKLLQSSPRERPNIISSIAYYGSFIVLIPMVFGGMIGAFLSWFSSLGEDFSYLTGFIMASAVSIVLFMRERKEFRDITAAYDQKRRAALERGVLQVHDLRVLEAWDFGYVEDVELYVLKLDTGDFAFLLTERVTGMPEDFLHEHMRVEVIPATGQVLSVQESGTQVKLREVDDEQVEDMGRSPLFDALRDGAEFGISQSNPFDHAGTGARTDERKK